jgi:hypothetical protein
LIRQKERAKERFESGEHLRPAVDSDWACHEVKDDDGVGMALRKEDQKREKKGARKAQPLTVGDWRNERYFSVLRQ